MTSSLTGEQKQAMHEFRQKLSEAHDRIGCWCCCVNCNFTDVPKRSRVRPDGLERHPEALTTPGT